MKPTSRRAAKAAPDTSANDSLDDMRLAYCARLQNERVHLVTLSAALARAEENPGWIFQDLQFKAHKLRGGAAIFEMAEAAALARALEEAAGAAFMSKAANTDPAVWTALVAMVGLMGTFDGGDSAPRTGSLDVETPLTMKRVPSTTPPSCPAAPLQPALPLARS